MACLNHPLEENLPLDQAIEILKECRSDPNIRYYDPKYRCTTCGRTGDELEICGPYHLVKKGPCHRLQDLLETYPTELLRLCQHNQFAPEDMRILNMGTEFGDQALIDIIIFNIINHSWKDMDELKEVFTPIFRLIDYAKFVNIVIFTFRLRCCENHQQFEEKFDWYQIIKLYVELMFEQKPELVEKFTVTENYRDVFRDLPRIKSIDHNGDLDRMYQEFKEDFFLFERTISTHLKNSWSEMTRGYAYCCSSTIQALTLHHYLISMQIDLDDVKSYQIKSYQIIKEGEAIKFTSTVPLSELIELFNNVRDSDNLPYKTLDYICSFSGAEVR